MILVTGGCGFIGSAFLLEWLAKAGEPVVNLDLLTYAGHLANTRPLEADPRYVFVRGDIGDTGLMQPLLDKHRPRAIIHFAAESHVDRSINDATAFIQTNVVGSARLLQAALAYWQALPAAEAEEFRFINVSTDEVFGSLDPSDAAFTENHPYRPNSPYSASKASADHFARAMHHTFKLPVITTNCSNNYGPRQFPEKLIPLVIHNALAGKPLPVYGDGQQVRDWLHVTDHCAAIRAVLARGRPGETYNVGGRSERTNLQVVRTICTALDSVKPRAKGSHADLVTHVQDRKGHDRRYAIDDSKIAREVGWAPEVRFDDGIRDTIAWYLSNQDWVQSVVSGDYRRWMAQQYGDGTGVASAHP